MQIFVVVLVVLVFVVSCNWFFPANHKSVSVLFLFTMSLLLCEAFLRMRILIAIASEVTLQWLKEDFISYLDDWRREVAGMKLTNKAKQKCCLSDSGMDKNYWYVCMYIIKSNRRLIY